MPAFPRGFGNIFGRARLRGATADASLPASRYKAARAFSHTSREAIHHPNAILKPGMPRARLFGPMALPKTHRALVAAAFGLVAVILSQLPVAANAGPLGVIEIG